MNLGEIGENGKLKVVQNVCFPAGTGLSRKVY